MIKVTLTTTTGSTKGMYFDTKENVDTFIEQMSKALPIGTAVNIDAPLIGIHSGWIQGTSHALVSNQLRGVVGKKIATKKCAVYFYLLSLYCVYHTLLKNIQILLERDSVL